MGLMKVGGVMSIAFGSNLKEILVVLVYVIVMLVTVSSTENLIINYLDIQDTVRATCNCQGCCKPRQVTSL